MEKRRCRVIVEGRVQGVFFRDHTQEEARKLHLTGWVRNRPDRTVEAIIEGSPESIDRMLGWFRKGSPMSRVTAVHVEERQPGDDLDDFRVSY